MNPDIKGHRIEVMYITVLIYIYLTRFFSLKIFQNTERYWKDGIVPFHFSLSPPLTRICVLMFNPMTSHRKWGMQQQAGLACYNALIFKITLFP